MELQTSKENEIAKLLRTLHISMHRNFNNSLEEMNLTIAQSEILFFLFRCSEQQEINQKDIERITHLTNPTVSGLLQRLEDKELIIRKVSKKDGRYRTIEVTEKALEIKQKMEKRGAEANEKLLEGISEEEQIELKRMITIMISNVCVDKEKLEQFAPGHGIFREHCRMQDTNEVDG